MTPDFDPDRSLLDALLEFGHELRGEGFPITTGQIEDVARALQIVGLEDRDTVFRVCRSLFVTRRAQMAPFRHLFDRFWRAPGGPGAGAGDPADRGSPATMPRAPRHERQGRFTIATYMAYRAREADREIDVRDRSGTFTPDEALRRKDFADMTPEELVAVRELIRDMTWTASLRRTRRRIRGKTGRDIDLRRVLARTARLGAVPARLPRRKRKLERRPVVLIADISGSMEKYSRLVLQLFHSMSASLPDVEAFLFGTRLTRITTQLRRRDPDRAIDEAAAEVPDWSGGTRIGASLATFNREWSRRVLRRGAIVVVVSDGCERDSEETLAREVRYLAHRCHRLVWLNPYVGHGRYEPRVAGMAAALPYVDDFLPVHDLQSLREFADALARMPKSGTTARSAGRSEAAQGPSRKDATTRRAG